MSRPRRAPSTSSASCGRPARFGALAALGALAAALGLAACGGSSSPSSSTSSAATAANNALDFSKCMREHGVKNFPNPETMAGGATRFKFRAKAGGPESVNPRTMEAAQKACKRFQPQGAEPNLTPQEKVAREEAVQKFARCMREHGIKVEASTQGGGIRIGIHGGPGSGGPNPESPTFQAAQKACQGLLPFKGGGGPGRPPAGGPGTGGVSGAGGPTTNTAHGGESSGSGQVQAGG
jgi:hypothetical protein